MSFDFENNTSINYQQIGNINNNVMESKELSLQNFNYIENESITKKDFKQEQDKSSYLNGVNKIESKCEEFCEREENQNEENEQFKIDDYKVIIFYQNDECQKNEKDCKENQDLISSSSFENSIKTQQQIIEDCELFQNQIQKHNLQQIEDIQLKICLNQLSINGYRIKSYLSKGGEGIVFKGYSEKSNQDVAIKFVILQKKINNATLQRTQTSARIKEQMNKEIIIKSNIKCFKFIVQTYFWFASNKVIVSVMEYCPLDLKTKLKEKNLKQKEMIQIMFQLLGSLVELHMNGIAHFDIKPANILIKENGDIKITDFGLSEIYEQKKSCDGATKKYCSPEQLSHIQKVESSIDFSSDIFSMGLTFLNILGYDFNLKMADKIRENKWDEIEFPQENKNHFTFIKYYMLNKNPNLRFRATILISILNYYNKKYIDMDSENQRIEYLINEKTDREDVLYSSKLKIMLYESTKNDKDLINSLQIQENLKDLTKQDEIHFELIQVRSMIGTNNYEAMKVLQKLSKEINQFKDNINYLQFLTNFGNLYFEFERYKDSLKYYLLELEATKKFFNKDHPFISQSYNLVAGAYRKLGQFDLALEYELESLEMREKYWTGDHPDFYLSFLCLYEVYEDLANQQKSNKNLYLQKSYDYLLKAIIIYYIYMMSIDQFDSLQNN